MVPTAYAILGIIIIIMPTLRLLHQPLDCYTLLLTIEIYSRLSRS